MKMKKMVGIGLAAFAFTACNEKVEEKLKTVYEKEETRKQNTFKVTEKFGALTVRAGEFTGESEIKPWSSWWFPLNQKTLFYNAEGGASTLEKYDFYSSKRYGEATDAAYVEEQEIYSPNEVGWAGLCHAWAIASVLHPEPAQAKELGGVKWTVADQKGLLLKTYEKAGGISAIMFGERYDGNRDDDYDDIYPDQFHKLLEHFLVKNKKPVLMDYDARFPVWTVPVYRVKFQIEKVDASSARVVAWVTFASPHVGDPNYVGTKRVVKNYNYLLKGTWTNGSLKVSDGEWIEGSKTDHPDYLMSFPDSIERGSRNEQINVEVVDSILE